MSVMNRIRLLILHEDPVAHVGLSAALQRHWDLEVVGTADKPGDVQSIVGTLSHRSADVVVANYELGMELAERESRRSGAGGRLKIVVVTSRERECEIRSAIERGVRGYLLLGCGLDELNAAVRAVHNGSRHLSVQVAKRLAESVAREPLTCREEEVLRLVVEGLGNKLIARRLDIAVGTVKSHLKGIFEKLQVESRTQAIAAAERRGLLQEVAAPTWTGADSQVGSSMTPARTMSVVGEELARQM